MHNLKHKSLEQIIISLSAIVVGIVAVIYAHLFNYCEEVFFKFYDKSPYAICLLIPLIFLACAAIVKIVAPEAEASGIPAVLEAIHQIEHTQEHKIRNENLVSLKTSIVKIVSSCVGVLGGMSLGMEGPMVQIASSIYSFTSLKMKKIYPHINRQIYIIAGGAAGIAAAFNTPIGGVAFALEELIEGPYGNFKQAILFSIILAGFTAISLNGNYLYFEININDSSPLNIIFETILIGSLCGIFGGLFAKVISLPLKEKLPGKWWMKAVYLGAVFSALVYFTHALVSGAGMSVFKIRN